jgi:small ligand-binding sensory domain FIST
VAFAHEVGLISRVTQGCTPVGPTRRIGRCDRNLVLELDGRPALDCLVEDLALDLDQPRQAMGRLRTTLAGIADAGHDMLVRRGQLGADTRVRHVLGLDPTRRGVAVADLVETGQQLAFCRRDVDAARRDLVRICSEIREELSPVDDDAGTAPLPAAALADWSGTWRRMGGTAPVDAGTGPSVDAGRTPGDAAGRSAGSAGGHDSPGGDSASQRSGAAGTLDGSPAGPDQDADPAPAQQPHEQIAAALYISCAGRGGPHFGAASAELKIVQRALGDVPLVGFFASGEIARHHLYGYTGVLTVLRCTP